MNQVLQNQPMTIFGDGKQRRAFSYIEDVAPIIAKSPLVEGAINEVFNIGSGEHFSVNAVYKLICDKFNRDIEPIHKRARIEPRITFSDCTKAQKLLGWKAKISLDEGLDRILHEKDN